MSDDFYPYKVTVEREGTSPDIVEHKTLGVALSNLSTSYMRGRLEDGDRIVIEPANKYQEKKP